MTSNIIRNIKHNCATALIVVCVSLGETQGVCKRGRRKYKLPSNVKEIKKNRKTKEIKRKVENLNETDQMKKLKTRIVKLR